MERNYTVRLNGFEGPAKVINDRRITVADVYTDREPGDQRELAALFAAAPDLLESLQAMIDSYEHEASPRNPALLRARAAVAKATGGDN